jgi:hypothetical protein
MQSHQRLIAIEHCALLSQSWPADGSRYSTHRRSRTPRRGAQASLVRPIGIRKSRSRSLQSRAIGKVPRRSHFQTHVNPRMLFVGFSLCTLAPNCSDSFPQSFTCTHDKCEIGSNVTATCRVSARLTCTIDREIERPLTCIYCWQLPESLLHCFLVGSQCKVSPRPQTGTCSVLPRQQCLGNRTLRGKCTASRHPDIRSRRRFCCR